MVYCLTLETLVWLSWQSSSLVMRRSLMLYKAAIAFRPTGVVNYQTEYGEEPILIKMLKWLSWKNSSLVMSRSPVRIWL